MNSVYRDGLIWYEVMLTLAMMTFYLGNKQLVA